MTPKFEPHSDHGTIHPPYSGACYQQGNHFYGPGQEYLFSQGADGRQYQAGASAPAEPAPQEAKQKPAAKPKAATKKAPATPASDAPAPESKSEYDLAGWVKGEKKIAWFSVKADIAKHYPDIDVSTKDAAIAGLKSIGIGE